MQLAAAATAQPSPLRGGGNDGTLRTFSHPDTRGHVRRASAGAPEAAGIWGGAGLAGLAGAPLRGLGARRGGGLLSGSEELPAEFARRSSGLTPGQEVQFSFALAWSLRKSLRGQWPVHS